MSNQLQFNVLKVTDISISVFGGMLASLFFFFLRQKEGQKWVHSHCNFTSTAIVLSKTKHSQVHKIYLSTNKTPG